MFHLEVKVIVRKIMSSIKMPGFAIQVQLLNPDPSQCEPWKAVVVFPFGFLPLTRETGIEVWVSNFGPEPTGPNVTVGICRVIQQKRVALPSSVK